MCTISAMATRDDAPDPRPSVADVARRELLRRLGTQWVVGQWLPRVSELARILNAGHVSTHRAVAQLAREGYLLPLRGKGTRVLKAGPASAAAKTDVAGGGVRVVPPAATTASTEMRLPGIAPPTRSPRIAIIRMRNTDPLIHRMVDACMEAARPMNPQFNFVLIDAPGQQAVLSERVDAAVAFNLFYSDGLEGVFSHTDCVVRVATGLPRRSDRAKCDVVTVNQRQVGYLAGRCLRDAGCDSVCFIGARWRDGQGYDLTSKARLAGFEAGWGEPVDPEHLMYGQFYGPKTGRHGFLRWTRLSPRPQGIFAASDELAVGVLGAAVMAGMKPGVDFQLVGVDGQERFRNATGFPLTSIQMPADAMGRQAARMVRQRLLEGEPDAMRVVLSCSLYKGLTVLPRVAHTAGPATDAGDSSIETQSTPGEPAR